MCSPAVFDARGWGPTLAQEGGGTIRVTDFWPSEKSPQNGQKFCLEYFLAKFCQFKPNFIFAFCCICLFWGGLVLSHPPAGGSPPPGHQRPSAQNGYSGQSMPGSGGGLGSCRTPPPSMRVLDSSAPNPPPNSPPRLSTKYGPAPVAL